MNPLLIIGIFVVGLFLLGILSAGDGLISQIAKVVMALVWVAAGIFGVVLCIGFLMPFLQHCFSQSFFELNNLPMDLLF